MKFWIPILACLATAILLAFGSCAEEPVVQTGYLNHAPEVRYTGRASCQSCHQRIYDSYLETGMGKSFYLPDKARAIEQFGPEVTVLDPVSGYRYHPFWQGDDFRIMEFKLNEAGDTLHRRTETVDYIVGSGHQTRSYLMNRSGRLYEMPITWYVSRQKWDLSPGYEGGNNTRFDREIGEECMACHTGFIEYDEKTTNLFREISLGIDCEKCHGPGQIHIERMEREEIVDVGEEIDYSIVNPEKLPVERQFDVCMQCHLQGVVVTQPGKSVLDFRPGMQLSSVFNIFIEQFDNQEAFGIASHAERLIQSQCFIQSGEKLSCTTCHDPHKSIAVTDSMVYVKQCQSCHNSEQVVCAAPEEVQMLQSGNCISCHMPKGGTADIPHVTFTDHRIRVVRDTHQISAARNFLKLTCMTDSQPSADIRAKAYLLYFERTDPKTAWLEIALENLGKDSHYEKAKAHLYAGNLESAEKEIESALATDPENTWYRFKKAEILEAKGEMDAAKSIYADLYAKHPQIVEAGIKQGVITLKAPKDPNLALVEARDLFTRLRQQKPRDEKILTNLGFVELNSGNFSDAEKLFREALQMDPEYLLANENLILSLIQQKQKQKAENALQNLMVWHPAYAKRDFFREMIADL